MISSAAMANRERLLQDLYNVTTTLSQPQITPILQGNFRMQGPMDESDHDIHANMMPFPVEKEYTSCSKNSKYHCRPESGTCNVCCAPCSSCLHVNQHHMGSKVDECSGEASSENTLSCSVNDATPVNKIVHGETAPKSRTRNFVSGSSSNTLENVDCEASCRNTDLSATSEIVTAFRKLDDCKVEGDQKDCQSCDTEIADSKLSHFSLSNGDNTGFPDFPVSVDTPFAQESVLLSSLQISPECLDVRCNFNESQNNFKRQRIKSKENLKELPLSVCSSAALSSQNLGLLESPSDTVGHATDRFTAEGGLSHRVIDKSLSSDRSPEILGENSCPRLHGELLKYPNGHVSSLSGETTSVIIHSDDLPEDDQEIVEKNGGSDNADAYVSNVKENSLESHPMDEGDDSDLVEHDIKVCDICGDAGREDLLAICSRCSDGAEHTYCMREMVDKVPLGDWLCEECKFDVQMKSWNQETFDIVDGSEKTDSSGQANPESLSVHKKFEAKVSDVEENRIYNDSPSTKILGKRLSDDVEVSCPAKRRILEPDNNSVNMSTSSAVPAISRNSSFKLDRLKTKINQHSSSSSLASPESANFPLAASRLQTQGTFIKSNSFNSLNVKPKVNLLDDAVPQKQRSVKESPSLDRKEGVFRSISKSVSFKSPNMGRPNIGESKVKMLSPKFSHIQDTKGSKYSKDRNVLERKNSFQLERFPTLNSGGLAAKNDKKLLSSGETNSLYSSRKLHDAKTVMSESRSSLLSKSSSFAARRGSEPSVSQGEVKRLSTTSLIGVSSTNADSNYVMKPNQDSLKVDFSSSYCSSERLPCNANEGFLDGLSQQNESTNFGERAKDSISGRSKQSSIIGGRTLPCQKCKEIGHSAQSCTADNAGSSSFDVTASKHPREGVDSKDKLKAAIEAAVLRKPGIYRKHKRSDQCNDASMQNINCEITSQVLLSDSSIRGNVPISSELKEEQLVLESSTTDFCKQETVDDDVKQFPFTSSEASSPRTEESCPFVPLEGLSLGRDVAIRVSEGLPTFFKRLAIPDNEYIWKGVFEVHRVGRDINLFDGIQAHLSACASPKVFEAVKKFNHKVLLNEVPRLTTWPVQFQENGVREDNIAIFFFAKDTASYEKSYKGLLNNMMKNDVALKGNFDGFELMIFPSSHLPEKSQRWNTLFFMWGVFRGKRVNKQHVLGVDEQNFVPQGVPIASVSVPMNLSSDMPGDRCVSAGSIKSLAFEMRSSEFTSLSSEELKDGCDSKVSSDITKNDPVRTTLPSDSRLNSRSFSVVQSSIAKSCGETVDTGDELRNSSIFLDEKGCVDSGEKREPELVVCVESAVRDCGFNDSQPLPINCNSGLSRQHLSSVTGAIDMAFVGNKGEGSSIDKMDSRKYEASLKGGLAHKSTPGTGTQMLNDIDRCTKVACDGTSQMEPGIATKDIASEEVRTREKGRSDCYGPYGGNGQTSSSKGSSLEICGVASDALPLANGGGGARDGDGDDISGERYFFPVDPLPEEEVGQVRRLMQSKMSGVEEDQLQEVTPNLELALGAETKTLPQGTPRFLVGKDDQKFILNLCSPDPEAAATKGGEEDEDEDDLSASLSLSLSFPFPEEERTVKPSSRSEQLLPEPGHHVNTSLLLFGLEGQVENRRPTLHSGSGRNSASQSQECERFM